MANPSENCTRGNSFGTDAGVSTTPPRSPGEREVPCQRGGELNVLYGCFQKSGYPQIIHFNRVFHYKPSILGYPYFWNHTFPETNILLEEIRINSPVEVGSLSHYVQGFFCIRGVLPSIVFQCIPTINFSGAMLVSGMINPSKK